jgi:AcrR family transcriptional regulator
MTHKVIIRDIKTPWILAGYELFAKEGLAGLKIEVLARMVDKSKSSFYHHFADMEVFMEFLLQYHIEQVKILAELERQCKNLIPDMLNLILEIKQDIFFNRQLRVNNHVPEFRKCLEKVEKELEDTFLEIWSEALGLSGKPNLARMIYNIAVEKFYLQVSEETLSYEWLLKFVGESQNIVKEFKRNGAR